jgi:aquaporin SIP
MDGVSLQMIGAVAGALAILEVMPKKYAHMLGGPKLKVSLSVGLVAETVLTFAITLTVLWAILRGPRNPSVKTGIIVVATIVLVMAGGAYTGPAMNPANVSFLFTLFHFMVRLRDCS